MITELPRRRIRVRPVMVAIATLCWSLIGLAAWIIGQRFGFW